MISSDITIDVRLMSINKTGHFLDPIIAIVASRSGFLDSQSSHTLEALHRLGLSGRSLDHLPNQTLPGRPRTYMEQAHKLKERSFGRIKPTEACAQTRTRR